MQIAKLKEIKENRDSEKAQKCLDKLTEAAKFDENYLKHF